MESDGIYSPVLGSPLPILRLGKVVLPTNLLIAPIAGYTDMSYRIIARRQGGVGLGCTDLLCTHAVLRQNTGTRVLMQTCSEDSPLCYQLFGGDEDPIVEAAQWCQNAGAQVIDINMGCPVDKVTAHNGGSALLRDPDRTVRMVQRIVAAVPNVAVTAKLRLGWDDSSIVAPQLARRLEGVGVQLITIHGRTREMQFSGKARLEGIAQVVAAVVEIPVIGNGDIRTPQDAAEMIRQTGCAGVMVGRAALGAPWIFRDVWSYLTTGTVPPELTVTQKCELMREHFHLHQQHRGEWAAVCGFRQRASWYGKTMGPCRSLREGMRTINTAADFERVMDEFLARVMSLGAIYRPPAEPNGFAETRQNVMPG
jgi:tRNA-dihydrouridine synthase B